ncbi:DUF3124 domain-containing protein [Sulfurisoma sediminicola]|uniref:Uncharacterized protein DUF3124 n=1 Tax=Sulfurisoma sediminicola TaxID=1381557 RepID=A0A497XD30_9PROT|nr:DUF3124 domain-containing protein [Sulfurisoma sediminicola]RLJ63791.1 uncharacterized protein DUF3124 [Sulfurisoma sediminicola]
MRLRRLKAILCALTLAGAAKFALAQEAPPLSTGQTLYLPIYSHLYHGEVNPKTGKPSETLVSTHVSIRNIDMKATLKITSARYYDTDGKLLREYLPAPRTIPPLGTYELFVPRSDSSGGSGANFIIDWSAERPINAPLVEALHADIREARTLLFVTTGRPIQTR